MIHCPTRKSTRNSYAFWLSLKLALEERLARR